MRGARQRGDAPIAQLERSRQYLAIPLRDLAPAHARTAWHVTYWRRHSLAILTVVAVLASSAGAWLAATKPPREIYEDASGIHIGSAVLAPRPRSPVPGYAFFEGEASLLIARDAGIVKASAAAVMNGQSVAGYCLARTPGRGAVTEVCSFWLGGRRLTSHDVYDPPERRWMRIYSDGVTTEFAVPPAASVVPVPLPLGRS